MQETLRVILPKDMPTMNMLEVRGPRRLSRMFNGTYNFTARTKGRSEWSYRGVAHERAPGEVGLFEPGEVWGHLKYQSPLDYRVLRIEKSCLEWLLDNSGICRARGDFHFRAAVARDHELIAIMGINGNSSQ